MKTRFFAAPALAAALALCPLAAHAHHDGTHHGEAEAPADPAAGAEAVALGDLAVSAPWSRATPPMANVAAGYVIVTNTGETPDRLLGGSSPRASRVEIHSMTMENDVARMREMPEGVEVPAGGELALEPGGYHLMLVGLDAPLSEGDRVPLTLRFESGTIDVELDVRAMGASGGSSGHGGH